MAEKRTVTGVVSGSTPADVANTATLATVVEDTAALEGRLTATRAGYLDNLSGGAVALAASVGTLVNSGGTATLGGILGDVANSSIAARLTALAGYVDDLETRLTAARAGYLDYLQKIDSLAVSGLSGTANSLAYKVAEIERHFHSGGRWYGKATAASGELHVADRIGSNNGAFQLDAGNNDWGSWVQVLGSTDTPADAGKAYFDPHQVVITAAERNAVYFIQFARGDSGAAGYAAGTYTEIVIETTKAGGAIMPVQSGRAPAGSKLWARTKCPSQDTGTIDFYIGIHEYEG